MNKPNRLRVRDLVNIGVFSALCMVVSLIFMIPSGFAPILWILWPCLAGLVCGVFFTLLLCLITDVLYFATGECTWVIVVTCALGGILAEVVRKAFVFTKPCPTAETAVIDCLALLLTLCGVYRTACKPLATCLGAEPIKKR